MTACLHPHFIWSNVVPGVYGNERTRVSAFCPYTLVLRIRIPSQEALSFPLLFPGGFSRVTQLHLAAGLHLTIVKAVGSLGITPPGRSRLESGPSFGIMTIDRGQTDPSSLASFYKCLADTLSEDHDHGWIVDSYTRIPHCPPHQENRTFT